MAAIRLAMGRHVWRRLRKERSPARGGSGRREVDDAVGATDGDRGGSLCCYEEADRMLHVVAGELRGEARGVPAGVGALVGLDGVRLMLELVRRCPMWSSVLA